MLATKIIYGIYTFIKNGIMTVYYFFMNFTNWVKYNKARLENYISDFQYKLNNLSSANLELGIYHLNKQKLNDAIIRFKLIDKFFKPGDPQANYLLGWTYFLKNNVTKAIYHLERAAEADTIGLKSFIKNLSNCSEIPENIWREYRNLITDSNYYINNFRTDEIYLPSVFIQKTLDKITDLPDVYNILEIGSNIGVLGSEVKKRFPDSFTLTGLEASEKMINIAKINDPDREVYNEQINSNLQKFVEDYQSLKAPQVKFDVILSFCGLTFTKDLTSSLNFISSLLNPSGYFGFCLPLAAQTSFSLKRKEFLYNLEDVKRLLPLNKFNLLSFEELKLGINNKYSIVILKKNSNE